MPLQTPRPGGFGFKTLKRSKLDEQISGRLADDPAARNTQGHSKWKEQFV
ncbi:MAG: hypothetical protein ACU0GG_00680 [Paracoccaceae bacterium]